MLETPENVGTGYISVYVIVMCTMETWRMCKQCVSGPLLLYICLGTRLAIYMYVHTVYLTSWDPCAHLSMYVHTYLPSLLVGTRPGLYVYIYLQMYMYTVCVSLQNLAKQILAEHAALKGLSGESS